MRNDKISQSLIANSVSKGKNTNYQTQLKTIFSFLQENIATATMVYDATGIPQKCITRHKRKLEKQGLLFELNKAKCKSTGCKAYFLTTNKEIYSNFLRKEVKNAK